MAKLFPVHRLLLVVLLFALIVAGILVVLRFRASRPVIDQSAILLDVIRRAEHANHIEDVPAFTSAWETFRHPTDGYVLKHPALLRATDINESCEGPFRYSAGFPFAAGSDSFGGILVSDLALDLSIDAALEGHACNFRFLDDYVGYKEGPLFRPIAGWHIQRARGASRPTKVLYLLTRREHLLKVAFVEYNDGTTLLFYGPPYYLEDGFDSEQGRVYDGILHTLTTP